MRFDGSMITTFNRISESRQLSLIALLLLFLLSVALKLSVIGVGSPFITIDDRTAFEGGFLVWFGHAPPQRMYLESWVYGIVAVATFTFRSISGAIDAGLGINLVADAYRDFYGNPDPYVLAYRGMTLAADMLTAYLVYILARRLFDPNPGRWAAVAVAGMYLLSYNTIWSGIVARPDSLLALYCVAGLLLYVNSARGTNLPLLICAAVMLGLAAGQKLHGALMAVILTADIVRSQGWRQGWLPAVVLALVSFFFFCFAAGSLFFDPLLYVKLRMLNYVDDYSPWIEWGDQFVTILRGGGWLAVPAAIIGAGYLLLSGKRTADDGSSLKTFAWLAIGWLLLFASIRQVRAYWMLPVLPVIYILAVYGVSKLRDRLGSTVVMCVMIAVLAGQSINQVFELRRADYGNLQEWLVQNATGRPFYILGYDAVVLPKSESCMRETVKILSRMLDGDAEVGLRFTERHVKHWEERTTLRLIDMLDTRYKGGYEFYDFNSAPPSVFEDVVGFSRIEILLVQDGFDMGTAPQVRDLMETEYRFVGERVGAGGGASGLKYRVYEKVG